MREYELMVIVDPTLEDKQVKATIDRHLATLTERGGKVISIDHWGKRRLSYEIRHITEGYYTVVRLQGVPDAVDELSRVLKLADPVIRHKIIRPDAA